MLFRTRFHEPIRRGEVTRTVRRWKRPQAKAGAVYRLHSGGAIEVTAVEQVDASALTEADPRASGYPSLEALRREVDRFEGDLYRVDFRYAGDVPDPRAALSQQHALAPEDVQGIAQRLARMDGDHPWTRDVLWLIEDNEGVRAADLAPALGMETQRFKTNVRRLKALGLTESLDTGYRISPRGAAFLAADPGAEA